MRQVLAVLALTFAAAAAESALADGFVVVEPVVRETPHLRNVPLWVRSHNVTVKVEDRVATTEVDQVFVNPNPRQLEGTYLFPLPEGATIDRFSMWIDGKEAAAELLDATKARDVYEGIVRSMRDPALLEYAERGLFKARIFPIDPNGEKRVRIKYSEILPADNGTVAYRYPLNTEKFSSRPLENVSVAVTIDAGSPVASVFSPSHKVDVPRDLAGTVKVGWEARDVTPDRDFLLYWRPTKKDVGISVIAHRDPSDPEGTFLLVLSPRPAADTPAIPKDVVFVVDTSGSMAGQKMDQARAALRFCLRSLGPGDRFGLVPFSTEARPFRDALVPADADTRAAAEKFVDGLEAAGGTAIDDALRAGLGMLPAPADPKSDRPAIVLFVTDGLPTIGETDVETILRHAGERSRAARLFVFGVGDDVNTKLLDRLATENRGARDYVAPTESIEEKVSNLYAKLARPAMTDLELSIDGAPTSAVHPKRLGDLFHGGEILVAGRYTPGNAVVRLRGKVAGQAREVVEEVRLPETETRHEFLPRLWAVRRVGYLLDELRLHGEVDARLGAVQRGPVSRAPAGELEQEIVRLAKRFGIVTPYTSYLIVEDETRGPRTRSPRFGFEDLRRRAVPNGGMAPGGGGGGGASGVSAGGGSSGGADTGGSLDDGEAPPPAAPATETAARTLVARAAGKAAEAESKDSGADAVEVSREVLDLAKFEGDKQDVDGLARALVRHVSGRTFVAKGGVWFDVEVDLRKERRVVEAFSAAYFELVRAHPEVAPWLKLGRVVLVVGDEAVEIKPQQ